MLDTLNKIASILSGFGIFIGAIFVTLQFKYKHDAEVRNLYLKNFEKMWGIARELFQTGRTTGEMHNKITDAFVEAKVYLHKDIVNFIEDIRTKIIEIDCIQSELEDLEVGDERSEKCNKNCALKIAIHNKVQNIHDLYRKHLIYDPWGNFLDWLKQFKK